MFCSPFKTCEEVFLLRVALAASKSKPGRAACPLLAICHFNYQP
jgi:hypothetical protein